MELNKPALEAKHLSLGYGRRLFIEDLDIAFRPGEVTAFVGPNGSGKSTLLKGLGRLLKPKAGVVLLDGADINNLPTREVARRVGILPQSPSVPGQITVRELVEQGRFPHVGPLRMLRRQDEKKIDQALSATGLTDLAFRPVDELSGGERQRAWIALVLAQDTSCMLLDEPTTYLDVAYQLEILDLIETLNRQRGVTIVMVLHDLNHAARYADRLVVLNNGRLVATGRPEDVLTVDLLRDVFRVRASITIDPASGAVAVLPFAPVGADQGETAEARRPHARSGRR